ncbi:MAG TPA: hypothetical protein PK122_06155 [Candidatus Paceibacterota bacterium]|nr:hypothetical protein [Candidatus Paceibacterota bacterium]
MKDRKYFKIKKTIADFVIEQSRWPLESEKEPKAIEIYLPMNLLEDFKYYSDHVNQDFWTEYPDWMEEDMVATLKGEKARYVFEDKDVLYFEDPFWGSLRIHFEHPEDVKKRMARLREEMYSAYWKAERQFYKYREFLEKNFKMQDYYNWVADRINKPIF